MPTYLPAVFQISPIVPSFRTRVQETNSEAFLASDRFVVDGLGQLRSDRRSASSEVSPTTRGPSNPEHLFISPFFKSGVALQFYFSSLCQLEITETGHSTRS